MGRILPFFAVLLAVAFFTQAEFFFYLLYTLFGIYFLGRLWARRSLHAVAVERRHDVRVMSGDILPVGVEIHNQRWLPVLWMRLSDTVPAELTPGAPFRQVVSLLPRERLRLQYTLNCRRRGYYPLGPFAWLGGDLLGTASYEVWQSEEDFVIVYPRIVPLRDLGFPSQSPFGTLPSRERLFEDPTRIRGVRDYQPGDSPRRMDWKTSARLGVLQVRRYEPAIALETSVFVNLNSSDYNLDCRYEAAEQGVVIAASVAVHLVEQRQAVGLVTNGRDPLAEVPGVVPGLPPRKGRDHLTHLLDLLARIETVREGEEAVPFVELLNRRSMALPWGSTALLVTPQETEGLLDTLLVLRRRGLAVTLVLTCPGRGFQAIVRQAEQIGVQVLRVRSDREMDVWR
jgi:uncharacterized protein (DUF58 family)